ncbi:YwmB family TATA-box binding protein [Metallumcola ferriviriculae]|uniref:YwmB family TATA-box binding protein n=1 Tax=Metallumcola ferriviriculae TaxID=3039180 RepID=A0AAU0ULU1_9FIRM|nr:YwmB family TATA-box binding protein [Desulfitibacteraceae bacterium MK1]
MKKLLTAVIFCGVIAAMYFQPIQATVGQDRLHEDPIFRAFDKSGAAPYELNIQGWAKINDEYMDFSNLQPMVTKVGEALAINEEFTRETIREETMRGITAIKEMNPGEYAVIVLQTLKNEDKNSGETYLILTLSRAGDISAMHTYRDQILSAFQSLQRKPEVSTWLTGTLPGQLTPTEANQLLKEMFTAAGVKDTRGISSDKLVSLSGYSPLIPEYTTVAGRKVNINIAVRYHTNDAKTYVYLGSPLLDGEY